VVSSALNKIESQSPSVIVAVRNEQRMLPVTVPSVLNAAEQIGAKVLWVCNACTDDSAEIIRGITGEHTSVLEIAEAGKTAAFNAGDEVINGYFPRFYVDSDARLSSDTLIKLFEALATEQCDLVAPRQVFQSSSASPRAQRIAHCWMSLPFASTAAFSVVVGLSERGRNAWEHFPNIMGDDVFIAAKIPKDRKKMVLTAEVYVPTPDSFFDWVKTRRRWLDGEKQLRELGLPVSAMVRQRNELLRQCLSLSTAQAAIEFLLVRLLAGLYPSKGGRSDWIPLRSR